MKQILWATILISSCGCHTVGDWLDPKLDPGEHYYDGMESDPEFLPYIQDFPRFNNIKIVFDDKLRDRMPDQPNTIIGTCFTYFDGHKEIGIYTPWWEPQGECRRKLLLWHEAGHCIGNLKHSEATSDIEVTNHQDTYRLSMALPNSIMTATIWSYWEIQLICDTNPNIDQITQKFCQAMKASKCNE